MTSVPGPAFRTHLATLDRETVTAFVAAVYAARGWAVDRDGDDLVATPPHAERPRRLVVRAGAAEETGDGGNEHDAGRIVVDAATLHELVAYALPADERARLCRTFLDRDPDSFGGDEDDTGADADAGTADATATPTATRCGPETYATDENGVDAEPVPATPVGDGKRGVTPADDERSMDRAGGAVDEPNAAPDGPPPDRPERSEWLGRVAVVGLALSLALGGIVTATGAGGLGGDSPAAAVFGGNETASEASANAFPRGVDETGVTDASALANAHEATLSNRSYRLTITYREFEDGELRGVAHERVRVASPDRYRSRVRRLGTLRHDATVVASGSAYANGSTSYVRTADGVRQRTEIRSPLVAASADSVGFVDRTERTVRWYLSTNDSRIVGRTERNGTATYRLAFEGDPWPASGNVTGRARVDEDGLVRELYREYTPRIEPNVRVEVTIRIVPGPVTVTRPAWLAAANDTDDGRAPARIAPARVVSPAGGRA